MIFELIHKSAKMYGITITENIIFPRTVPHLNSLAPTVVAAEITDERARMLVEQDVANWRRDEKY